MGQEIFDWILLLIRWVHITVAVTWIGTSIFFMWLDRSFEANPDSTRPGHVGELWMVHGGGFYHVEKLLMGPTKVPERLHWFKWESYWTWMSGFVLMALIYYTGDGTMLIDSMIRDLSYPQALGLSLFSIFGSWFFYDFVWERNFIRQSSWLGHTLTLGWFVGMSYILCHSLSGRAAYIHIGGMLGTWMTANVFMRIIPRQIKMVEASKNGLEVNQEWGKNAKNRSTHNTYFTLPVIFIMLSNHFPQTYGHESNWLILLIISAAGAAIREYFVTRLKNPPRASVYAIIGIALLAAVIIFSFTPSKETTSEIPREESNASTTLPKDQKGQLSLHGVAILQGEYHLRKKLNLPGACAKAHSGDVYSNEVMVKDSKLQNVLIQIIKGHEALQTGEIPQQEVILDQRGCIYTPRVTAARVGQRVTFVNSDSIFHNVRSVTKVNEKFNVAMPHKNQRITKIFNTPELFLQAKCSVHPWMGAYVAVMDHPYYAVTDEKGEFQIKGLPPGTYEVQAWHEVFGTLHQQITISAETPSSLKFIFNTKESHD
jgi:uncharacterized membrane protein/plastocyanin